ncbi:MAG: hypothetical protein E4G99_06645 [Anaerolineales bacterium]|nr:MAG: hypothetical protein E4G99_06645 [Anaerolineales bacterium]
MRGYRVPKVSRTFDVVIVAARYVKSGKQLACGQAFVRRGPIWGDLRLLDRNDLIRRLEERQTVVTGRPAEIPGEFVVFNHVRLGRDNDTLALLAGEKQSTGDSLGLPLF